LLKTPNENSGIPKIPKKLLKPNCRKKTPATKLRNVKKTTSTTPKNKIVGKKNRTNEDNVGGLGEVCTGGSSTQAQQNDPALPGEGEDGFVSSVNVAVGGY
jgi:hypothetical protein